MNDILIGFLVVVGSLLVPFGFVLLVKFLLWFGPWFNEWKHNPLTWYLKQVAAALEWAIKEDEEQA